MSFGGGSGSSSISGGSDVALSNPADGQVLTYDGTLGKWQNEAVIEKITTITSAGTSQTLTIPPSGKVTYVLTASSATCSISLTGATATVPAIVTLWLKQGAAGNRSWTFPSSTIFPLGTAPSLSTAAGNIDVVTLTSVDGGTSWLLVPAATQAS